MKIKAVIIEDEAASRLTLRNYLLKYCPQVELLGEASNIKEGYNLIQKTQPQLVFLDIEMPFGNAFDLLDKCAEIPFETIFVTSSTIAYGELFRIDKTIHSIFPFY